MADAGKLRHHRDDKPQKNPPPQHDARIMEQVQRTPQAIAEEPKPDVMTSKPQDWLDGQSGAIGLTPVVSADLDSNVVQPSANGSAHPHVKPQRLHGGDEHVTENRG